ncbi:DoxX family protein [Lacibacterium aquatile]|uniref:DoxX family protein n=1 Tax=Lacibacterium aquatile TaxID=1168082 RepID=A0ABW5DN72_9PROT
MSGRLIIPALGPLYATLANPAETLLRVVCGALLIVHGWPKIQNPTGAAGMVERIGFAPGEFWSVLLSISEFFSGIFLLIGFLTRPAAAVATIILLVTVYFHWIVVSQGYAGSEKSILWAAVTIFFMIHGARTHSVDNALKKEV